MGDRAQIFIPTITAKGVDLTRGVYLYTHNDGHRLPRLVQHALSRVVEAGRDTQEEYLARMVFCAMVRGDVDGALGYGIGTGRHFDLAHPVIAIEPGTTRSPARVGIETGYDRKGGHSTYEWTDLRRFLSFNEEELEAWYHGER